MQTDQQQRTKQGNQRAFLAAFRKRGNISKAAEAAGISRRTVYDWKNEEDGKFLRRFNEAHRHYVDHLEDTATELATEGSYVTFRGQVVFVDVDEDGKAVPPGDPRAVGQVPLRQINATVLIFKLKGELPHKYRDTVHHTGSAAPDDKDSREDGEPELTTEQLRGQMLAILRRYGISPEHDADAAVAEGNGHQGDPGG